MLFQPSQIHGTIQTILPSYCITLPIIWAGIQGLNVIIPSGVTGVLS